MLPPEVFLDTAFALALANPHDLLHTRATNLADQLEDNQTRLITTRAVLVEIGNALARLRYRAVGIQLLVSLESDPNIMIVPFTENLYHQASELYRARPDKEWGLTDCISFVVMHSLNLTDALTYDHHFQQAGFRALLRDNHV